MNIHIYPAESGDTEKERIELGSIKFQRGIEGTIEVHNSSLAKRIKQGQRYVVVPFLYEFTVALGHGADKMIKINEVKQYQVMPRGNAK